jgi:adenylate kinase family enzyme
VRRVAVIGPVAAGKTTFARRLGAGLGLPVIDLDDVYWREPHQPSPEAWAAEHARLLAGPAWVIAGDYRATAPERLAAADTVVWLDLPVTTCVVRALRRHRRGYPAPLLASVRWILRYSRHGRRETEHNLAGIEGSGMHRVRTRSDADRLLQSFLAASAGRCR